MRLRPESVLDYGCGDGYTGSYLAQELEAARLVAFDLFSTPELPARNEQGKTRISFTQREAELPRHAFDLVLLCDVLEHVRGDTALLRRIVGDFCKPGARLLITVPAFQCLFSEHDRALQHHRRYALPQLCRRLARAGLRTERSGYLFGSLLAVRSLAKLREAVVGVNQAREFGLSGWRQGRRFTRFVESSLTCENAVMLELQKRGLPYPGLTAWALCSASGGFNEL